MARLGVSGLGAVVIFTGLTPLTEMSAFAAQATTVTLSPDSDTAAVGTCNEFTATVAPNGSEITVNIQQAVPANTTADTVAIGFCDPLAANPDTGPTGVAAGAGTPGTQTNVGTVAAPPAAQANSCSNKATTGSPGTVSCNAVYDDTNSDGKIVFGVASNTPGNMTVNAFGDTQTVNGAQDVNESGETSNKTWVANTSANNDVISCTPTSAENDTGDTHTFHCTVTNSSGVALVGKKVGFRITSGPDAGVSYEPVTPSSTNSTSQPGVASNAICSTTDDGTAGSTPGEAECSFDNNGEPGTDSITVYEETSNTAGQQPGEPSTTISKTFTTPPAPAPNTSTVTLACSPNPTNSDASICQDDPRSDNTATFTATVKNGTTAVAGVRVNFDFNGANNGAGTTDTDDTETLDPVRCVTDSNGQCSTTFTDPKPLDGESFTVRALVPRQTLADATDTAKKNFHIPTPQEARNITVEPNTSSKAPGSAQEFTATVVDRFTNPVPGVDVNWTETGPGAFRSGTQCTTGTDGTCKIEVSSLSGEQGTETVTGTIEVFGGTADDDECASPAGYSNYNENGVAANGNTTPNPNGQNNVAPGAEAGNCSDNGSVTWQPQVVAKRTVVAHINCWSPKRHVLKCKVVETPAKSGLLVKFKRRTHSGIHVIGSDFTNSNGVARLRLTHLKSHKLWRVFAHVYASATTKGDNTETDRTRIK